jgi:transcriptional regulator with XRE-family HTH domain
LLVVKREEVANLRILVDLASALFGKARSADRARVRVKEVTYRPYEEVREAVLKWLGPRIRRRMDELGLSLPAMERLTGIGSSTISDYIAGRYEPSLSKIMLLSDALKVDWDFFFNEEYGLQSEPLHEEDQLIRNDERVSNKEAKGGVSVGMTEKKSMA